LHPAPRTRRLDDTEETLAGRTTAADHRDPGDVPQVPDTSRCRTRPPRSVASKAWRHASRKQKTIDLYLAVQKILPTVIRASTGDLNLIDDSLLQSKGKDKNLHGSREGLVSRQAFFA
jgi:hypothetical protein